MHSFLVDFESMLVAPLLSFLTYSLVNDDNSIVAETSDDWLRDACSRTYLGETGQVTDGIDDVRANSSVQLFGRDHHEGRGRILESLYASNALNGHFAQDGFLHGVDTIFQTIAVFVHMLCKNRLGNCQKAETYIYNNVFHIGLYDEL